MDRSYKEQYERLKRSLEKCLSHSQWGDSPKLPYYGFEKDIQGIEDDFIHYFQDCLNLRDWITKDPSVPKNIKNKVKEYYKNEQCLKLARDLANASKHLKLDPSRVSVSTDVDMERVGIGYAIGSAPLGIPPYSRIFVGVKTTVPAMGLSRLVDEMEAEELATLCKNSIDTLLKNCNLM
jgi:hypothetical protein